MKTISIAVLVLVIVGIILGSWVVFRQNIFTINPTPTLVPSVTNIPSPTASAVPTIPATKYMSPLDWPPKVNIDNKPFSCTEAGTPESGAGRTQKMIINDHTYCVTKEAQGAAGSIYTQYAYARAKGSKTEIFTFSIRRVQCGNYPEPEKSTCETERRAFNEDTFMDQYIQTQP